MKFTDFFSAPAHEVAPRLIGAHFSIYGVGGQIVEVEAYDQAEPASHSFAGPGQRNAAMFGPPGTAYVYRSYGIHWCLNFVCCPQGHGAGVLIRALAPTQGLDEMRERRGLTAERMLCSGPGKLGQALGVSPHLSSLPLNKSPFELIFSKENIEIIQGPRIGISKAADLPWRFGLAASAYLSRPFRISRSDGA